MSVHRNWTVELMFTEDDQRTDAQALLRLGDDELWGWGHARRNPADPSVPKIGEEIAAARALSDLAHKLLDASAAAIEHIEHHPVRLDA